MDATQLAIRAVKAQAFWDAADMIDEAGERENGALLGGDAADMLRRKAAELHPEFARMLDPAPTGAAPTQGDPHLPEAPR